MICDWFRGLRVPGILTNAVLQSLVLHIFADRFCGLLVGATIPEKDCPFDRELLVLHVLDACVWLVAIWADNRQLCIRIATGALQKASKRHSVHRGRIQRRSTGLLQVRQLPY